MTHFNPDMLSIARNFRGLSQTELIAGMGQSITQASLSKIESGDLKPSDEVIQNLMPYISLYDFLNILKS